MSARYNINAIMCESADENVTRIENIFNSAKMERNGTISFDVVTFVSCIGEPTSFSLAYFLQHITRGDGGPITFLNAVEYKYEGEEDAFQYMQNVDNTHYKDVNLDGAGHYILRVYKYEESELRTKGIDFKEDFESWIEQLDEEHVMCIYEFDVRK